VREIAPGEVLAVDAGGMRSLFPLGRRELRRCVFEHVYFARPDSHIFGGSVDRARRALGRRLALECPAPDAELVFSVPDSSNAAALGYAEEAGLPLELALIRNHYVGRTFIQPTQTDRDWKVKVKYNAVREVLAGRRVVMVDDSIVRGTTTRGLVAMVREAGAREVHMRVSSAPVTGPCYYGIDTPSRDQLIAARLTVDEIAAEIGADSLGYLSLDGMLESVPTGPAGSVTPASAATTRRRRPPTPTSCAPAAAADRVARRTAAGCRGPPAAADEPAAPVTRVEDTTEADVADQAANDAVDEQIEQTEDHPVVPGEPKEAHEGGAAPSRARSTGASSTSSAPAAPKGTREMKAVLGGKGANLAEMTNLGVPVPPGFTIACSVCVDYLRTGGFDPALRDEVARNLRRLEEATGKRFGDPRDPLLVSVRSGAPVSMPGMMETILNLGLTDDAVEGLAALSGDARFAYDSYRRFIQMYADVVLGVPLHRFEQLLAAKRTAAGVETGRRAVGRRAARARRRVPERGARRDRRGVPVRPRGAALGRDRGGVEVLDAQEGRGLPARERHRRHVRHGGQRRRHGVRQHGRHVGHGRGVHARPEHRGAQVLRRVPRERAGRDVVAGIRTPLRIAEMAERLPGAYEELMVTQERLERHFCDMQDIEFTVERGKLYLLQTRTGKRAAASAVRIAEDMVREGLIRPPEAVRRVAPAQLDQLLHPVIDASVRATPIATGLPASPGAASGVAVFDADSAERRAAAGEAVILVREETTPEDFHGMVASRAILTSRGGMTSHAAVVARGMGKCAVVGAKDVVVDDDHRRFAVGRDVTVFEGDWITLDGASGNIYQGDLPTVPSEVVRVVSGQALAERAPTYRAFSRVLGWADEVRTLRVRANADTPRDARLARAFGAEGIGLCRTEHMFFEGERITAMREMIVARDEGGRRRALAKLLPMQRTDFEGIFEAMDGCPVTIRLLDPPLHEFLPHGGEESKLLARTLGVSRDELSRVVDDLRETNPMLGHRGCRLGVTYPEITEMQSRAIFEAAVRSARRGITVKPEVMIPLVATHREFEHQAAIVRKVAGDVLGAMGVDVEYLVGTMIELPRAALTADEIAPVGPSSSPSAPTTSRRRCLGLSRDDAGRFLLDVRREGDLPRRSRSPVLDETGVGKVIRGAIFDGRSDPPDAQGGRVRRARRRAELGALLPP
jgi:pyruvate,orthophosphate dikinase